ncbi:ATP-binding cassette domain-containing protein [Sphingobacterium sp. SGG-5]|uniref:ABC transporter ATP-binding protein n=1 Tax=Sphingobacterium sp. SGG-5 TaxID=2710881 RepID=UPI0013ED4060|nr:ATP-binding cassette domain-containing protein [Sphingobacterium sp. SGG-5]NGM62364.1 ATP-binding cassette domain-containing protein [Sphingobacterium sp. SGG-5]
MTITLHNLGRRFDQQWIFRNINYTFSSSKKYAILGPNGSGKSTLLKTIAGQLSASEGRVAYLRSADREIHVDDIYPYLVFAAPYMELIEEFTLTEMIDFHFKFKSMLEGFDKPAIIAHLAMEDASHKQIKYFSSGMKQRLKLALACFSASAILLLDEPTSNLDVEGEKWYRDLIDRTCANRLLIIGSNQEKEYDFCDEFIRVMDYK